MHSANTIVGDTSTPVAAAPGQLLRGLAFVGALPGYLGSATSVEYARLYGEAYSIVWPLVLDRLTRRVEFLRGHPRCAQSIAHMEPDCFDLFADDVDAVIRHLFSKARAPIHNLEGWITSRLTVATVDGHRQRRGARGALQRPRLPGWLTKELDDDPWLTALAVAVLVWVGVPITVGASLWPYDTWAERRVAITGDRIGADTAVVEDVETVLAAMRRNPAWYEKFVERPLGRKRAPLTTAEVDPDSDRQYLALTQRHERDDARLLGLAAQAVSALATRLKRREDPRTAVAEVLSAVFGAGTGAERMDVVPGAPPGEEELVAAMVADPESLDRIVDVVLELVSGR